MKRLTTETFIIRANLIHNKYNYSKVIYGQNNTDKIIIICLTHGEFKQTPSDHLSGCGCPNCGGTIKSNTKSFISKAIFIHGNSYTYKKFKYINTHHKGIIDCDLHGEFKQSPSKHLMGHRCPKCRYIKFSKSKTLTNSDFIEKANKIHRNKYDYSSTNYLRQNIKIDIICLKHGPFFMRPNDHLKGQGCPKCFHRISNPEIEFMEYFKIPNTSNHRQKYIKPYSVDAIKDNIIYEFLGDYWHGNPIKFKSDDINKSCKQSFGELYSRTFLKFKDLKNMGYNIKYIWENDWNNFKKGIDKTPKILNYI